MSDYLVEIECEECGEVEYFSPESLPGGPEHCPYCSECGALLPSVAKEGDTADQMVDQQSQTRTTTEFFARPAYKDGDSTPITLKLTNLGHGKPMMQSDAEDGER